jgi:hypothetical protein
MVYILALGLTVSAKLTQVGILSQSKAKMGRVHITPVDPEVATAKVPIEMNLSIADKR